MNSDVTPKTSLLYREELKGYDFGIGHPFRGDRYRLFYNLWTETFPEENPYFTMIHADRATADDLLLIHDEDYIRFSTAYYGTYSLANGILEKFSQYHNGDNSPGSRPIMVEDAARIVVGEAKTACALIMSGLYDTSIVIGGGLHHAKRRYGEGFCIYNDVAFAGLYMKEKYQMDRILILDTDAHGGNGTMEYFYDDPNVLFIDIHQDPGTIYPHTGFVEQIGEGKGKGYTVNIPLPAGAGDKSFDLAFESVIMPLAEEFKPQIIIQNGGSDPHKMDALTNLNMSLAGFRKMGANVKKMAEVCDNKLLGMIASGYTMEILPYAWMSLISGLSGVDIQFKEEPTFGHETIDPVFDETQDVLKTVRETLKYKWNCLK